MHVEFMQRALELADKAASYNEVPVGAVVVNKDNQIVGEGYNQNIINNDPCAHAEILALKEAANNVKNHRLIGCKLYVTLEPCMMCLGAIIHARIDTVIYAASDSKTGCFGGKINLNDSQFGWNHNVNIVPGIMGNESSKKLKEFFRELRARKKMVMIKT